MATPAPHVPVSFLLAGGVHAFSEACVKAMLACGIHPDMVGSYGDVAKRTAAARQAVEGYEQAVREGRERVPPEPTFQQRWMACCTAGHLTQDAAHVRGSGRGNNCATLVDGYTEQGAPTMATLGNRDSPDTVEGDVSAAEERQADARRAAATPPGNTAYPANARREDEDARIGIAVQSQQRNFPRGLNDRPMNTAPVGSPFDRRAKEGRRAAVNRAERAGPAAAIAAPNSPAPAAAAGEPQVQQVQPNSPSASPRQQAIECLQNYRDAMGSPEARRAAIDREIARRRSDPAARQQFEDERARQDRSVATAQGQHQAAQRDTAKAQQKRNDAATANAAMPSPKYAGQLKRAEDDLDAARAREQAAAGRVQGAQQARAAAGLLHPEQQVRCLQAQRARIDAGNPNTVGRIPGPGGT